VSLQAPTSLYFGYYGGIVKGLDVESTRFALKFEVGQGLEAFLEIVLQVAHKGLRSVAPFDVIERHEARFDEIRSVRRVDIEAFVRGPDETERKGIELVHLEKVLKGLVKGLLEAFVLHM